VTFESPSGVLMLCPNKLFPRQYIWYLTLVRQQPAPSLHHRQYPAHSMVIQTGETTA
jgi:hypothetical protein